MPLSARVRKDIREALEFFSTYKLFQKNGRYVLRGYMQSNSKKVYLVQIGIPTRYPYTAPVPRILKPHVPPRYEYHMYRDGGVCLFLPNKWNPGKHNIKTIIERTGLWLNKLEVALDTGKWPGEDAHKELSASRRNSAPLYSFMNGITWMQRNN